MLWTWFVPVVAVLAALYGLAFLVSRAAKVEAEWALAAVPPLVALALYGAVMVGALGPAALMLLAAGLAAAVGGGLARARAGRLMGLARPGVLLPLAGCALAALLLCDARLHIWDEISYWGLASRIVGTEHRLLLPTDTLRPLDYPPGITLFHAFFLRLIPFADGTLYAAHAALWILPLAVLLRGCGWGRAAVMAAVAAFAVQVFGVGGLAKLYSDHILGVYLGVGAYLALEARASLRALVPLCCIAAFLPLVKSSGLLLAVCLAFSALTALGAARLRGNRAAALGLALLLAAPVALQALERWRVAEAGLPAYLPARTERGQPAELLTKGLTPFQAKVVSRFFDAFGSHPVNNVSRSERILVRVAEALGAPFEARRLPKLHVLAWLIVLAGLGVTSLALLRKEERRAAGRVLAVLGAGHVVFLGGLLYLYFFVYTDAEALRAASFPRYNGTFLLAYALPLTRLLLDGLSGAGVRMARRVGLGWAGAFLALFLLDTPGLRVLYDADDWRGDLERVWRMGDAVATRSEEGSALWIFGPGAEAVYPYPRYLLHPRRVNVVVWNGCEEASGQAAHLPGIIPLHAIVGFAAFDECLARAIGPVLPEGAGLGSVIVRPAQPGEAWAVIQP